MTQLTNRAAFSDRVRGLFFDFLACGVETTSGWRTLHSSLPTVLAEAVIPSLALTSADRELWQDDEDEFIRRHVEDEGSDALVFHEECVTARRSAMNFVAVLAAREARDAAASKPGAGAGAKKKGRKRGRKRAEAAKSKHLQDCISQLIASVTGTADEKPSASKRRRSGGDDREGAFALESKHYALLMVVGASSRNLGLKPAMVCPPSSVILALLLSAHLLAVRHSDRLAHRRRGVAGLCRGFCSRVPRVNHPRAASRVHVAAVTRGGARACTARDEEFHQKRRADERRGQGN